LVTRAYRKAIDALEGKISFEQAKPFIDELENVSHRECTTGFYYRREDADKTTVGASDSKYVLVAQIHNSLSENEQEDLYQLGQKNEKEFYAQIDAMHPSAKQARLKDLEMNPEKKVCAFEKQDSWFMYKFTALNKIDTSMDLEFVSSDCVSQIVKKGEWKLINFEDGTSTDWTCNGHPVVLYTKYKLQNNTLVRMIDPDYKEGVIRDYGR
jgi:putative protease